MNSFTHVFESDGKYRIPLKAGSVRVGWDELNGATITPKIDIAGKPRTVGLPNGTQLNGWFADNGSGFFELDEDAVITFELTGFVQTVTVDVENFPMFDYVDGL